MEIHISLVRNGWVVNGRSDRVWCGASKVYQFRDVEELLCDIGLEIRACMPLEQEEEKEDE